MGSIWYVLNCSYDSLFSNQGLDITVPFQMHCCLVHSVSDVCFLMCDTSLFSPEQSLYLDRWVCGRVFSGSTLSQLWACSFLSSLPDKCVEVSIQFYHFQESVVNGQRPNSVCKPQERPITHEDNHLWPRAKRQLQGVACSVCFPSFSIVVTYVKLRYYNPFSMNTSRALYSSWVVPFY